MIRKENIKQKKNKKEVSMHNLIAHALVINENNQVLIIRRTRIKRGKLNFEGEKWDIPGMERIGELACSENSSIFLSISSS